MAFFLLKWVWNSVADESGKVAKKSLNHQLQSNKELLAALNKHPAQLKSELDSFSTEKRDALDWTEFMDFFFYKGDDRHYRANAKDSWWLQVDPDGKRTVEQTTSPDKAASHQEG